MRRYRVWTKDSGTNREGLANLTCCTTWLTRGQCKTYITSRWGHWPSWAVISEAQCSENFRRAHNYYD